MARRRRRGARNTRTCTSSNWTSSQVKHRRFYQHRKTTFAKDASTRFNGALTTRSTNPCRNPRGARIANKSVFLRPIVHFVKSVLTRNSRLFVLLRWSITWTLWLVLRIRRRRRPFLKLNLLEDKTKMSLRKKPKRMGQMKTQTLTTNKKKKSLKKPKSNSPNNLS